MLLLALTLAPPESKDFVQVLLLLTKNWAANQKNIGNPTVGTEAKRAVLHTWPMDAMKQNL